MKALFLDRDGTIFENAHYLNSVEQARTVPFMRGAMRAIAALYSMGYYPVIITNQGGVGRGYFTEDTLIAINEALNDRICREISLRPPVYYCPHDPEAGCECRKPKPGLILRAARELGIDVARSIMVGDMVTDKQAGEAAGCALSYQITDWAAFPFPMHVM